MNHRGKSKWKNTLKRYVYKADTFIKEKSIHLSNGWKIVLFWIATCTYSLFIKWIDSVGTIQEVDGSTQIHDIIAGNAFSGISGKPGFMIILILGFIFFSLFSIHRKEKMKLISSFYFQDFWVPIIGGLFILVLSYNAMSIVWGYSVFVSGIVAGKWPILSMSWALATIIWWALMKHEFSSGKRGSFMSDIDEKEEISSQEKEKKNMRLPI